VTSCAVVDIRRPSTELTADAVIICRFLFGPGLGCKIASILGDQLSFFSAYRSQFSALITPSCYTKVSPATRSDHFSFAFYFWLCF